MVLSVNTETVRIKTGNTGLEAALQLPEQHLGIVLCACDGHIGRVRPPGDYLAGVLRDAHLGTLRIDLHALSRSHSGRAPPETPTPSQYLTAVFDWLRQYTAAYDLPISVFGTGNAADAVLQLAASRGRQIASVVLRGGRPDISARFMLGRISAPTLLIVGELDDGAVEANRCVYTALRCEKGFQIVPGATRQFSESGCLEVVARMARRWLLQHAG